MFPGSESEMVGKEMSVHQQPCSRPAYLALCSILKNVLDADIQEYSPLLKISSVLISISYCNPLNSSD